MADETLTRALDFLESHWDQHIEELKALVRIGGVSAESPPNPRLKESADAVVRLMKEAGLEHCRILELEGAHPYAYGEWLHAEGAPTLLLYGHHDVQPVGRPDRWETPPFEPTLREDGRLYGRGAVDDKAGVMMHIAAVRAWLRTGKLPLNVKFIVEGEEETGSEHLEAFLEAHKASLAADCIVLTDTANLDNGIPSLTTSLRGMVGVTVEVRGLARPLHNGMWGGPVPDPVMALVRALSTLSDPDGRPAAFLRQGVEPLSDEVRASLERLPFDQTRFRNQAGMPEGAELVGNATVPVYGRIWREPAVTIIALEASPLEGSSNQIVESARARINVRTVPKQDPAALERALIAHLETAVPWGLETHITPDGTANWWVTEPEGPAFDAARRAMEAGYGRTAETIGCGGTIPFVEPFARVLGGVPALLTGVEDPLCNAHSENESLHVEDWKKGTRAAVTLYAELARALEAEG